MRKRETVVASLKTTIGEENAKYISLHGDVIVYEIDGNRTHILEMSDDYSTKRFTAEYIYVVPKDGGKLTIEYE